MMNKNVTYLKLKSGEAHLTEKLGIGGINRIAILIWFLHKFINESR